ncbi:MAG TPA: YceI family protein [Chloroflexota bacterium]
MFTGTRIASSFTPLVLALGLLSAACTSTSAPAAPAAQPPAADPAASALNSTAPPAAGQSGSATAPGASAPDPAERRAASAPGSAQPPTASAPGAGRADLPTIAGELRFIFASGTSQARYRAREQFVGAAVQNDAVGSTNAVSGQIVVDTAHNVVRDASRITVDLRSLESDQRQRDQFIQQNTLQTAQYPTAEFVPTEVRGLPATLPASGALTFQLAGDLTVHGVTHPVVWDVQAQMQGADASGTARTEVTLADFSMTKPQVARILSIEDTIALEMDFQATSAPAPDVSRADSPRGT